VQQLELVVLVLGGNEELGRTVVTMPCNHQYNKQLHQTQHQDPLLRYRTVLVSCLEMGLVDQLHLGLEGAAVVEVEVEAP
jgi:hypothetical protein